MRFLSALLGAVHPDSGVWVCDADMVWLAAPPEQWIRQAALLQADVLLSSDCLDLAADGRGECGDWANLNTGVLYLRGRHACAMPCAMPCTMPCTHSHLHMDMDMEHTLSPAHGAHTLTCAAWQS